MPHDWVDLSYLDVFHLEGASTNMQDVAIDAIENLEEGLRPSLLRTCLLFPGSLTFVLSVISAQSLRDYVQVLSFQMSAPPSAFPSSLTADVLRSISDELASCVLGKLHGDNHLTKYRSYISSCMIVLSAIASNEVDAMVEARSAVRTTQKFVLVGGRSRVHASSQETPAELAVVVLGYAVPSTRHEWQKLSHRIMGDLSHTLQEIVHIVRESNTTALIKDQYLSMHSPTEDATEYDGNAEMNTQPNKQEYAQVVSDTFSLHTVQSFGEWPVLLSVQAASDIRKLRKKSIKEAEKVVRKIRELSQGTFTKDNQLPLKTTRVDTDVFRAWVLGDVRLVYYIDCIDNPDSEGQMQAIKVLGVYSLSAMKDDRMWDSVIRQLGGRSDEEKRRSRERMESEKGKFLPMKFPRLVVDTTLAVKNLPVDPSTQSDNESMLDYQKYIVFSQAYLSSLLADKDLTLPFAPGSEELKIITHPSSCYVYGRSGTGKTTAIVYKMLARDRAGATKQIFLTKSPVLAERVQKHYQKLRFSIEAADLSATELKETTPAGQLHSQTMVHARDRRASESGLPRKFGDLRPDQFPLFITFDQLMDMLEAEMSITGGRLTSYSDFLRQAWSRFPANLKKNFDPALVWSQILGIIKGSEVALRSEHGYMDREAYVTEVSRGARALFNTDSQRHHIYDLFECYRKWQHGRDAADRTRALLAAMEAGLMAGKRASYIYVDEVQDILLIEALVLFSLCANEHGLLWAGDTAQTISTGSAFRFADLKSLVWRAMAQIKGPSAQSVGNAWQDFQLHLNYRSHAGIVNCAASLVKFLIELWPESIDPMGEERGFVDGPKPVVFGHDVQGSTSYRQFVTKDSGILDFGSEQCIIVRNDDARDRLLVELGDVPGLVYTVLDSKGLEFDDVLLLNFFKDSGVSHAQWRRAIQAGSHSHSDRQADAKIQSICYELKSLYVAVTRARKTLWIIDESDCGEPLMTFWLNAGLVSNGTSDMRLAANEESHTAEAWKARASTLFDAGLFSQAEWAFIKAGCSEEAAISRAYTKRENADLAQSRNSPSSTNLYLEAAHDFLQRADCNPHWHKTYCRIAAECFEAAGHHSLSGDLYASVESFDHAALQYLEVPDIDRAMDMLSKFKEPNDPVHHQVTEAAKLVYLQRKDFESASLLFAKSFEAMSAFVEDHEDLHLVQADMYEWGGKILRAATICLSRGQDERGLELLLRDPSDGSRISQIIAHILSTLRSLLSFGVTNSLGQDGKRAARVKVLLGFSSKIKSYIVDRDDQDDLMLYHAIVDSDLVALRQLVKHTKGNDRSERRALLGLDHLFSISPILRSNDLSDHTTTLRTFLSYGRLLKRLSVRQPKGISLIVKELFAVRINTRFKYDLPPGSFLYKCAKEQASSSKTKPGPRAAALARDLGQGALEELFTHSVKARLVHRVKAVNHECMQRLQAVRPSDPLLDVTGGRVWQEQSLSAYASLLEVLDLAPLQDTDHVIHWIAHFFTLVWSGQNPDFVLSRATIEHLTTKSSLEILAKLALRAIETMGASNDSCMAPRFIQMLAIMHHLNRSPASISRIHLLQAIVRPAPEFDAVRSYALHDFAHSIRGDIESSVVHGASFLDRTVRHRLEVDVIHLASFIRATCVALVVGYRYQRSRSFHSLVLPKDGLLETLARFLSAAPAFDTFTTELVVMICTRVQSIMDSIHSSVSPSHFVLQGKSIHGVAKEMLQMITQHMFVSLRIVGTMIDEPTVRTVILQDGHAARIGCDADTMFSSGDVASHSRGEWAELVEAPGQPRSDVVDTGSNIKTIVYDEPSQIIPLLLGKQVPRKPLLHQRGQQRTAPRLQDPQSVVQAHLAPAPTAIDPESVMAARSTDDCALSTVDGARTSDVYVHLGPLLGLSTNPVDDDARNDHLLDRFSEADILVLSKLPGLCRYFTGRRTSVNAFDHIQHNEDRRIMVAKFQQTSLTLDWTDARKYLLFYRSIVPHAYFAISHIADLAAAEKKAAKESYEVAGASERQTTASGILKKAIALQKELGPSSKLHAKKDITQLRACVQKIKTLVLATPFEKASYVIEDVQTALAAIR